MSRFGQDPIPGMPQEPGHSEPTPSSAPADLPEAIPESLPTPMSESDADIASEQAISVPTPGNARVTAFRILNGPWTDCLLDIPATGDEILLGRNDPPAVSVDIDMTDAEISDPPMVSRRHAILRRNRSTGDLVIEDAGSTNGTWVDGERVRPGDLSKPIAPDVMLRIANINLVAVSGDFTV